MMALMKKEKDESVFITQTLKGQLSQAQAKADQVPALEIERNDLREQNKNIQKQLDSANTEISTNKTSITDLKAKLEKAKKDQESAAELAEQEMMMGPAKGLRRGNAIKKRPLVAQSNVKESGSAQFFKNLQRTGSSDVSRSQAHMRQSSMANSAQLVQQMQATEDIYSETINQLQADRMRLKGKDMYERLTKLSQKDSAFSIITQQLKSAE